MIRLIAVLTLLSLIWVAPAPADQSPFAAPDEAEVRAAEEKAGPAPSQAASGGAGEVINAAELAKENALPPVPPAPPAPVLVPPDEEATSPAASGGTYSGATASSGATSGGTASGEATAPAATSGGYSGGTAGSGSGSGDAGQAPAATSGGGSYSGGAASASSSPSGPAPTAQAEPAGRVKLKRLKGFGDYTGRGEKPGPDGSPDVNLHLEITAPGLTVSGLTVRKTADGQALWDTLPGNGIWLVAASRKNKILNSQDGRLSLPLVQAAEKYELWLTDNHTLDRGKDRLELVIAFEGGRELVLPVQVR